MPQIRVQFAALDAGATTLEQTYGKLQELIAALEAAVAPMVATWEGEAREAYHTCQTMWRAAADDLGVVVRAVKDGVVEANELAQAGELRNRNLFPV